MNCCMESGFPSLAQYFAAPEDFRGVFGWMCGYSADAAFLNEALERFTLLTKSQRAYDGRVWMALMLDPGNPRISFTDAPGVVHLGIRAIDRKPFALLHAKVALLGFRGSEDPSRWRIRLIVSTGNWTRQTLEESLDLAWCIEVDSADLKSGSMPIRVDCADIKAAHSMFKWLEHEFDLGLLKGNSGRMTETAQDQEHFARWLNHCADAAGNTAARFFDNRDRSLLEQLPEGIKSVPNGSPAARNYLAMGSGFYEAADAVGSLPSVPLAIRKKLRDAGLLTQSPEIDIFINPTACQAVGAAVGALATQGFIVRPAAVPNTLFGDYAVRSLHAKFIFSANYRENSDYCGRPWIYLGSGNLTTPGFRQKAAPRGGNLEAGVLFVPDAVAWYAESGIDEHSVISNLLPIQWDTKHSGDEALGIGEDFLERPVAYVACPIAWLTWQDTSAGGELAPPAATDLVFDVLDIARNPCPRDGSRFRWSGSRPREVIVRWSEDAGGQRECPVPVVDELGRIAGTPLPELDLADAWWQLADFPLPPAAAEDETGNNEEDDGSNSNNGSAATASSVADVHGNNGGNAAQYPIRQMMEFVENIAARQTKLEELEWFAWCLRLEQTLSQVQESSVIAAFIQLELNPLSPLRAAPFRPTFAQSANTAAGKNYEAMLDRIEVLWGVAGLTSIGREG